MTANYLPSPSPIRDEAQLARAIVRRHGTHLLRFFSWDDLIHEVRLGFWLGYLASQRRGRPNPPVGFLYRAGMWRLKNLWRLVNEEAKWVGPADLLADDEEQEDDWPLVITASQPEDPINLEPAIQLIERLLDFHSRGQGRLNVRRWLMGRLIGETLAETAAALGIPKSRLAAQIRAMRLYLAPYRRDIQRVLRGELAPEGVPLRPARSRWAAYGAKKGQVTCDKCGQPARTLHHIQPRRWGGSDERNNLAPLCERCHGLVEVFYMRMEKPGMLPSEWQQLYQQWKEATDGI